MAQETKEEPLLQVRIDNDLYERFAKQRERWGMTNREMMTRMLEQQLPEWEAAGGPPGSPS